MTLLFRAIAVNSLRGGVLILAVLLLRALLRKTPRRVICFLWGLAALRLMIPVRLTAFFGLLPGQRMAAALSGNAGSGLVSSAASALPALGTNAFDVTVILPWLWLTGAAGLLLFALIRSLKLRRALASAVPQEEDVLSSDRIPAPFAFGLFKPKIYLPSGLPGDIRPWVLAHERAHIRRGDTRRKAAGFALLALYWFQPLCWLGWFAFCRDLELACDERATEGLTLSERKRYAMALLECSAPSGAIGTASFGEKPIQSRVRAVLRKSSRPRWLSRAVGALCTLLILCLCFEAPAPARNDAPAEPCENAASPAEEPAEPEAHTGDNSIYLVETSCPVPESGENGAYRAYAVTIGPSGSLDMQVSASPDGQDNTIALFLGGEPLGVLHIEEDGGEPARFSSCSARYESGTEALRWEIRRDP